MPPDQDKDQSRVEVRIDYSNFDVMGQSYPEPIYTRGKPCIVRKVLKEFQGRIVGWGGVLFDNTRGMRLYDVITNAFVLVDPEEAFKYGSYVTCSYTWKHDPVEQEEQVKMIVR
jgi:hypothetical protein